jgi:hypothetical protein
MKDKVLVFLICTVLLSAPVLTMVSINRNAKKTESFHVLDNRLIVGLPNILIHGAIGRVLYSIINTLNPGISTTFKMFPFSTDPIYEQVWITADDDSGMTHQSANGNLWFSCNCPKIKEHFVTVILPKM